MAAYDNEDVLLLFDDYESRLEKGVEGLRHEFAGIKAGKANPHMLDRITVDYYGCATPLNQVGNVSAPEARMLVINVWDVSMLKNVEKAILAANIGVTPTNDGKVIRLVFPELTEKRRREYVKQMKALAENCKVSLRNARRDINDELKKLKKDSAITEDDLASLEKDVDKKLNDTIAKVEKMVKDKEAEIMCV